MSQSKEITNQQWSMCRQLLLIELQEFAVQLRFLIVIDDMEIISGKFSSQICFL